MLENKIVEIEKGDKKKTIDKKIEAFEKSYEQKIETLNTMLQLNEIIEEKDEKIVNLANKFKQMEKKFSEIQSTSTRNQRNQKKQ